MIHNISRFIAALALILLTAQTAGAQTVSNVPYIDADGNEQTATYATVVTSDMGGTSADNFSRGNGWYYVNSDVTLNGAYNTSTYTQNIILGDGATLTVSGLFRFQNASLNIYCQSGGTGRLVVSGSYGSNAIFSVTRGGTLTINGGTVEVTNTSSNGNGFNGNLVMNGGTATFTSNKGVTCYAITGSVTLNGGTFTATSGSWKDVCDKTVTIGDGKYFKDGSGNIYYGTLTDAQNNALNGVTLSPATKTEYIQACLGTGNDGSASKPYTISDAAGWDAFCLALQDNDTWNRFSGKTVKLGNNITVSRMAGGSHHDFTGTFDGNGKTLTFNYTTTENYAAPFRNVESGCVIENLHVSGTINTSAMFAAGLVGDQYGAVTIRNCRSSVTINSTISGDGTHAGFVARNGNGSGSVLTIEGCVFDGRLLGPSTNSCGGFIGWRYKAATIYNSLFAPAEVTVQNSGSATFARNTVDTYNCYYTTLLNDGTNHVPALADGTVSPAKWHNGKATRTVAAAADVTIEPIALTGDATQYTVSGITAYSGGGLQRGETLYYGSDDQLRLTLSNSATGAPLGYQYGYTASAGTLSGTTLTMPEEDVTINAALRSDGQPVNVAYIKADGTTDEASAIALDGHETVDEDGDVCLDEGTYYVGNDITYANRIYLYGDVTLILADGKTMTLNDDTPGIFNDSRNLTIYGQSLDDATAGTLRYNGTADGITVNNYEQHSGNVSITTTGSTIDSWVWGIDANDVTLRGGTLTVTADGTNAIAIMGGTHSILGGQLTATATGTDATGIYASANDGTVLTLGWTRPADRITASSISTGEGVTVAVADGKALTDGSGHIYTGTLSASVLSGFAAKTTLQPALQLADKADNATQIATFNGIETAAILAGRTLYKDGSWNTLCLPFDISTASGTLSGNNVQAMTLDTETSNLTGSTLTLNFDDATGQTIPAGTPFIIKWDESGTDITNPVFKDVTIDAEKHDATVTDVLTFTGTYVPVTIDDGGDNTKLYLGSANTLYYPTKAMTIGCHRAYFQLAEGITAGEPVSGSNAAQIHAFNLNFGDDEATGIVSAEANSSLLHSSLSEWYTIDGVKLAAKPTAKGLYIHNGKKVAIK